MNYNVWFFLKSVTLFIVLSIIYTGTVYFIPNVNRGLESFYNFEVNQNLLIKLDQLLGKIRTTENNIDSKIDNIAPNTSQNIKGRTGQ
ncbi:hypothetical protein GW846_02810 [Candidatus Gracilibacteria bacterium]|nr:hypothetical protein [Candidatus Gracilibacteria bacterium]